jgi:hypothetical protein
MELLKCFRGLVAKRPVDSAWVEPQSRKSTLQVGNIVAPHSRFLQVQQAISQWRSCANQLGPRVATNYAIGSKASRRLKLSNGAFGSVAELIVAVGRAS